MARSITYPSPGYSPRVAMRIGEGAARIYRNLFGTSTVRRPTAPPFRVPRRRLRGTQNTQTDPTIYGGSATRPYKKQYGKRRQSRRKRARARKYYKSFRKAFRNISGVAMQKAILNGLAANVPTVGKQGYCVTHLFSYNGNVTPLTLETGVSDIQRIRNSMSNTVYTDDVVDTSKFMIEYGIIDYTLRNSGTVPIEVDIYHLVYRDNVEYTTFAGAFNAGYVRQQSLTSTATDKINIENRGATLFDFPVFLSNTYASILSKEKVFLNAGEISNFQYKSKRPFSITKSEIDSDNAYFARKGKTHTWMFVFKAVAGITSDASLTVGSTRTYGWRVDGETQPGTATLAE